MEIDKQDTILIKKISDGEKGAWNFFVKKYSPLVMSSILRWCNSKCSFISEEKECEIRKLKDRKKFSNESMDTCDLGVDLFTYIFEKLRLIILRYRGESSLRTFIIACITNIFKDYFIEIYGKINIPTCLEKSSEIDIKVFKIICKSYSLESIISKGEILNLTKTEVLESYYRIINTLKKANEKVKTGEQDKVWVHIMTRILKNSIVGSLVQINSEGEENEIELEYNDQDYVIKEFNEFFEQCLNKLSGKRKRLLELRFKKSLDVKEIFDKFKDFFGFKTEDNVYQEIDKAIKELVSLLRTQYSDEKFLSNADIKNFKANLEDYFYKFSKI